MDLVLNFCDKTFLNDLYPTSLPPSHLLRQCFSLFSIALVGVTVLYFTLATFNYYFLFDHENMKSPKFLKNQIYKEIKLSVTSFPLTSLVTVPWFLFEVRGYSKLYHTIPSIQTLAFEFITFILFTDFGVYWIHRFEHHPMLYSWLHKPHHQWKISTPFASFAFHPLDGYFQSLPMHIYVYLFPMNSYLYLAMFVFIQIWTISIHDGVYVTSNPLINSCAHHTIHHLEFNYNYGQYFTLWDRIGGSYKRPSWEFENNMVWDKIKYNRHVLFEKSQ